MPTCKPDNTVKLSTGYVVEVREPSFGDYIRFINSRADKETICSITEIVSICTGQSIEFVERLSLSDGAALAAACGITYAKIRTALGVLLYGADKNKQPTN